MHPLLGIFLFADFDYNKKNLFKLTNHGTDFKWSIWGGGRFRELEYHYNGIVWALVGAQIKRSL